jgi:hypothetical protein
VRLSRFTACSRQLTNSYARGIVESDGVLPGILCPERQRPGAFSEAHPESPNILPFRLVCVLGELSCGPFSNTAQTLSTVSAMWQLLFCSVVGLEARGDGTSWVLSMRRRPVLGRQVHDKPYLIEPLSSSVQKDRRFGLDSLVSSFRSALLIGSPFDSDVYMASWIGLFAGMLWAG